MRIILDEDYHSYEHSLLITGLKTLKERRSDLSLNFALKCTKNEKSSNMFPLRKSNIGTRRPETYQVTKSGTSRLAKSAIPTMQKQLNEYMMKKKLN